MHSLSSKILHKRITMLICSSYSSIMCMSWYQIHKKIQPITVSTNCLVTVQPSPVNRKHCIVLIQNVEMQTCRVFLYYHPSSYLHTFCRPLV